MFDHVRRHRPAVDADRIKEQAADLGAVIADRAADLAEHAKTSALHAKDWAEPRVEHLVESTRPRAEKLWHDGVRAAQPKVERAAEKSLPMVDTAHDKLVDDLLPKLVASLTAAAAATAAGADKARDVTSAKLSEIAHVEPPKPPKSHTGAKVFWLVAAVAAIGAAFTAWRSSRPTTDPWAEQPWEPAGGTPDFRARSAGLNDTVTDVKHELGEAAEHVGELAGETVARTREATEKAAEKAREATEKAKEATRKASSRRRSTTSAGAHVANDADVTDTQALSLDTPAESDAPDDVADTTWTEVGSADATTGGSTDESTEGTERA